MGPLIAALLLGSQKTTGPRQAPGQEPTPLQVANRRFRDFMGTVKSLSVHMTLHRKDLGVDGSADLILVAPDKLYYHFTWGRDDYTYAVSSGRATEVDRASRLYDEYPVPYVGAPEANGSYWITTFFPAIFIDPNITLPAKSFDAQGRVASYSVSVGNPPTAVKIQFSDYKLGIAVPDSKFQVAPPAGFVSYSTQRVPAPIAIGQPLPNLQVTNASSKTTSGLLETLNGKPTLLTVFGPESDPGLASIPTLAALTNVRVVLLNLSPTGTGIDAGSLPVFFDPQGRAVATLRAYRTPTYYLVDGKGVVSNVWYGFDRRKPDLFLSQLKQALAEQ